MKKTALEHFQDIKELEVADERGGNVEDILPYKCEQVEKSLKALEIIKEKNVSILDLRECISREFMGNIPNALEYYNEEYTLNEGMKLTEEEFELLKEVLE